MNEWKRRIEEINEQIENLREEERKLIREHSGWFIGTRFVGDGDYWDEYFVDLGFCTAEEAEKWAYENGNHLSSAPMYFEVTREERDLYYKWYNIYSAMSHIGNINGDNKINLIRSSLSEIENKIVEDLDIKHPEFQHICQYKDR